jgi:hypothetical protein
VIWLLVGLVVVVALASVVTVQRRRSPHSSVDSFRRQIDALGPEARRSVVDQLNPKPQRPTEQGSRTDEGRTDEDGARGS